MNTNNEMNIIRGILNEQVDIVTPESASIFTPSSSVPGSVNPQTKRPLSHEELMDLVKKSLEQTQDALQAAGRRDAAVTQYRNSAPAAPNEAAIRQDARANFTTDGHWDAEKYKAWRAGRAADGAEWAQRGEARDRVAGVKKENEKYLGDLKANLQQSRTAKTPEERKGAFNMAMTNVDTFVSKAEGRQQKIDTDRTPKVDTQGKPIQGMDAAPPTEYFKKNPELWEKRKQAAARLIAAKTPEERQRHMDEVKKLDTGSEPLPSTGYMDKLRQQGIDPNTGDFTTDGKPWTDKPSKSPKTPDVTDNKQPYVDNRRYLSSEEMADMQRKANAAPSTDKYAPSNLPDLTDKPDPNNRQPSGREGTVAPSYTDWKNGVTRTPPKPQPGKYDKVTASGTPYTDLRAQWEDKNKADLAAANKTVADIQKKNRDQQEAEKMVNDVIAIAKTVKTK